MLGDIIVEAVGKLENRRILSVEGGIPQIEVTISKSGKIRGNNVSILITYRSIPNSDGTFYIESEGVIMTKDWGDDPLTFKGQGVAKITGQRRKDVGSIFFNTSTSDKLSFLNNSVGVFEDFAEDDGTVKGTVWEWR